MGGGLLKVSFFFLQRTFSIKFPLNDNDLFFSGSSLEVYTVDLSLGLFVQYLVGFSV